MQLTWYKTFLTELAGIIFQLHMKQRPCLNLYVSKQQQDNELLTSQTLRSCRFSIRWWEQLRSSHPVIRIPRIDELVPSFVVCVGIRYVTLLLDYLCLVPQ